jgi:hypothetical protein
MYQALMAKENESKVRASFVALLIASERMAVERNTLHGSRRVYSRGTARPPLVRPSGDAGHVAIPSRLRAYRLLFFVDIRELMALLV